MLFRGLLCVATSAAVLLPPLPATTPIVGPTFHKPLSMPDPIPEEGQKRGPLDLYFCASASPSAAAVITAPSA